MVAGVVDMRGHHAGRAQRSRTKGVAAQPDAGGNAAPSASARWAAGLLLGAAAVIDVAYAREASLTVLLVFGPFVASALLPPRDTAVTAAAAVVLASGLGWVNQTFGTSEYAVRVAAVGAGGALAIRLASERTRRERQLRQVRRVAATAQEAILRPLPPSLGRLAVAARYVSASSEAHIGGDFYEALETPFGTRLVVGDVRGKGLDAVRLAASLVGEFRSRACTERRLAEVVRHVERVGASGAEEFAEDFATAVFAQVSDASVELIRCGHPEPLLASTRGAVALELPATTPICLGADPTASAAVRLGHGERILLYSDGAIEARDASGRYFDLRSSLERTGGMTLEDALDVVLDDLRRHCGGEIGDDVVLVLAELNPDEGPPWGADRPLSGVGRPTAAPSPVQVPRPRRGSAPRPAPSETGQGLANADHGDGSHHGDGQTNEGEIEDLRGAEGVSHHTANHRSAHSQQQRGPDRQVLTARCQQSDDANDHSKKDETDHASTSLRP